MRQLERVPEHLRVCLPPPESLTVKQATLIADLLLEYQDVFVGPDGEVGWTDVASHSINVGDAAPIRQPPRRVGFEAQ